MKVVKALWNKASKFFKSEINKSDEIFEEQEDKIRKIIFKMLEKEGTRVSMAPISNKYYIKNQIDGRVVIIDGSAEVVKTPNHVYKWNYKCRAKFIDEMIKHIIGWIEEDRENMEVDIFKNEMDLLDKILLDIDKLPNKNPS